MTEQEKWKQILELAEKYGFLVSAYSGIAVLATKEEQKKIKNE